MGIEVPDDSKLVRARTAEAREETQEKEDLKRFVMQYEETGAGDMSGSVIPITVRTRAGKGAHGKGAGKSSHFRSRDSGEYLKEELMPEESKPDTGAPSGGGITVRYKG